MPFVERNGLCYERGHETKGTDQSDVTANSDTSKCRIAKLHADVNPIMARIKERLENEFINQNKLGLPTGQGFYSYPNPAYESATFLKG